MIIATNIYRHSKTNLQVDVVVFLKDILSSYILVKIVTLLLMLALMSKRMLFLMKKTNCRSSANMKNFFKNVFIVDSKDERTEYTTLDDTDSAGLSLISQVINLKQLGVAIEIKYQLSSGFLS